MIEEKDIKVGMRFLLDETVEKLDNGLFGHKNDYYAWATVFEEPIVWIVEYFWGTETVFFVSERRCEEFAPDFPFGQFHLKKSELCAIGHKLPDLVKEDEPKEVSDQSTKLRKDYEDACNAYLKAFCEKHDYLYEGTEMWVGEDAGGVACCGDGYFDMATIRTDIDKDAPEEELLRWYDYTMDAADFHLTQPNFEHWLLGCPRTPKEWFDNMRAKRKEFEDLLKEERERVEKQSKL